MVSPLVAGSDFVKYNPYFFQINPEKSFISEKTAELIAYNYFKSNVIIVVSGSSKDTDEDLIAVLIQEKMANFALLNNVNGVKARVVNNSSEDMRNLLRKDKENVIFIATADEGTLSMLIQKLNNLSNEFPITFVAANHRYLQKYTSIQVDYFHNLKMEYIAPYWVDYQNSSTIRFIEKFKENFNTEPGNYGTQGYDIALYFLSVLKNFGKKFENCLPYLDVDLVQGTYSFSKVSKSGGYTNEGASVVSCLKNFDVERKRIIGNQKK